MSQKPAFRWFTADQLISAAGGDPWEIAEQLHAGDAGAINDLAEAFHRSGTHVKEADEQFNKAKEQFKQSYDRNNGSVHPINDSAEVEHMSAVLAAHPEELTKIAANLEQTAAALATAQHDSTAEINELNAALHSIDDEITSHGVQIPLVLQQLIDEAEAQTKMSLGTMTNVQGAYIGQLQSAETALLASGYVPDALDDADAVPGNSANEAADEYKTSGQLDKDRETVTKAEKEHPTGPGMLGWSLDQIEAKRRLDDYATLTDPDNKETSPVWYKHGDERDESQYLAGQRLNDWNVANSKGPVAKDPILGGDMRDRAKARLYMQRALQDGQLPNHPGLRNADDATKLMNALELQDRTATLDHLKGQLIANNLSAAGAQKVVDGIAHGIIPPELQEHAEVAGHTLEISAKGAEAMAWDGKPGPFVELNLSEGDRAALESVGKHLGRASSALEIGMGIYEWQSGQKSLGEAASETGGALAGGWLGAELFAPLGAPAGPPGVFVMTAIGAVGGGIAGKAGAEKAYAFLTGKS